MAAWNPAQLRSVRQQVTSVRAHLVLAGLSALLLALSFPRPGWGWLAHLALVPVALLALRSGSVRRLTWTLYVVSLVWWLVMIRWMVPVTAGGQVGLSAYMALYYVAPLLLLRWLDQRWRAPAVLALPLAWTSFELMRGWFLQGGFAWFALAHSQAPSRPEHGARLIIQIADLFGEQTVTLLVVMTSGMIVDVLNRPWVRRSPSGRRKPGPAGFALALWGALLLASLVYGGYRVRQTPDMLAPGPRLAVIQTSVPQDNKDSPDPGQHEIDWQRMLELTRQAVEQTQPDLVAWPETMVPSPLNPEAVEQIQEWRHGGPTPRDYHEQTRQLAMGVNTHIIAGASAWLFEPYRRYNSAYLYRADGQPVDVHYDKVHRVPFGEYVPWVENWPWLKEKFIHYMTPYDFDYTLWPGASVPVFEAPVHGRMVRFATPICFEDTDPRLVRRMAYDRTGGKRCDFIVNLTNDGWFAGTHQREQHLQIAVLRSVENRVPTARSVNTGISGFIDSAGRIGPLVQQGGKIEDVDGFAAAEMRLDRRRTFFGRWGATPMVLLACATALWAVAGLWEDKFRRLGRRSLRGG